MVCHSGNVFLTATQHGKTWQSEGKKDSIE